MEADIDSFSMASGYPRTDLTPELDHTPISNHGLAPSGVVIVKFNNVRKKFKYKISLFLSRKVAPRFHRVVMEGF